MLISILKKRVSGAWLRCLANRSGQATVEAAFALPVVLICILLLAQPGIILYDRMVMRQAALEGCRALVTNPSGNASDCRAYVLRRLGSIPPQDLFHVHQAGCSWVIKLSGNESSGDVSVSIDNAIKPLPLINVAFEGLGLLDSDGYFRIHVEESLSAQPAWLDGSQLAGGPSSWIGAWCED